MTRKIPCILIFAFAVLHWGIAQSSAENIEIKLSFSDDVKSSTIENGRLFLFFSQSAQVEPRTQTWPNPTEGAKTFIFAKNISTLDLDKDLVVNDFSDWTGSPEWPLKDISEGTYYVQALWDQDQSESRINAPGNLHSDKQKVTIAGKTAIDLVVKRVISERNLVEHDLVKMVEIQSDTLSKWWNKPMYLKATVLLPSDYDQASANYAIRYNVAGYGGRYNRVNYVVRDKDFMDWWMSDESPQVINVFLDGEGPFGDSYQMDSDNSGPYGYALINELIPHIEAKYRGTDTPETRFVDGCSTGGWVSLGLQLYYPDHFNGVFSYSPDAIEFENYQLINIYEDKNAFVNEFGYSRPVMRDTDGEPMLALKDFIQYENVLGSADTYLNSGGQFSAHTALYSPKGENDLPQPLFDPITGEIDASVAAHWEKYDFKRYARRNWATLGPKLQGKIYVWMGDMDHFYLNQATREFAQFLERTKSPKSDATIEFTATEGHCSMFSHRVILEQIQERLNSME